MKKYCNVFSVPVLLCTIFIINVLGQDGNEPNDSFTQATAINLDSGVLGTIDPSSDVDYFRVETPRSGTLIARLAPVPAGLRIQMQIFNSDQQQVQNVISGTGQLVETAAVLEAGTNYVVLSRWSGGSTEPYTLTLTLDPNDLNEANDSFTKAAKITLGTPTNGTIRPNGDVDFFAVDTPRPGALIARLAPVPTGLRIQMQIFNSDQQQVQNVISGTGQLVETAAVLEAGTNYVVLSRWSGGSTEPYTLALTLDPNEFNEVNDSFTQAYLIGTSPTQGTIRPTEDVDYFKFEVTQQGAITALIDPVPAGLRIQMTIFNSDQEQVQNVVSGTGQRVETSVTLGAGTNYVALSRWNGSSKEPYTLTLQGNNIGTPTSVESSSSAPKTFRLAQNYPNPFNPTTTISFHLASPNNITITIYDMLGRIVRTLINRKESAGSHQVQWDGANKDGHRVASGVYVYRLEANGLVKSRKMLLLQ